ncbi:MAG: hypothetical protein HZA53_06930 [Planctomycetes bacterium]|nr:hypothetical protein [Planctomycetota bacterium]
MDHLLPPAIQARFALPGASRDSARVVRVDAGRGAVGVRVVDACSGERNRTRVVGLSDTPVDPLQLIWTIDRDREDFSNF